MGIHNCTSSQDDNEELSEITDGSIKRDIVSVSRFIVVGTLPRAVSLPLVCLSSNSKCASLQNNVL